MPNPLETGLILHEKIAAILEKAHDTFMDEWDFGRDRPGFQDYPESLSHAELEGFKTRIANIGVAVHTILNAANLVPEVAVAITESLIDSISSYPQNPFQGLP